MIGDVLDHDHDLRREEQDGRAALDGFTVVERCQDDECAYWRAEWVEKPTLERWAA